MSNENANRQAFPSTSISDVYSGLTKREYFAAMAMQGLISGYVSSRLTLNVPDEYVIAEQADKLSAALLTQLSQSK